MPASERGSPPPTPRSSLGRPTPGIPVPEAPTVAFFAAFLGGVLSIVEGLALLAGGTEPWGVLPVGGSAALPSLGGIGVAAGIGVVAAGFAMQENVEHRVGVGGALVVLGAIALVGGGGFLIGSALSIAGGLIAVFRKPLPLYALPTTEPVRDATAGR